MCLCVYVYKYVSITPILNLLAKAMARTGRHEVHLYVLCWCMYVFTNDLITRVCARASTHTHTQNGGIHAYTHIFIHQKLSVDIHQKRLNDLILFVRHQLTSVRIATVNIIMILIEAWGKTNQKQVLLYYVCICICMHACVAMCVYV
jgi:hypothetical protein